MEEMKETKRTESFFEKVLKGQTILRIEGLKQYNEEVRIYLEDGSYLKMHHRQDCCECVRLEDFECSGPCLGKVIDAYEEINEEGYGNTGTWTFYRIRLINGAELFMRWLGSSNGYYGEQVDLTLYAKDGKVSRRQWW